MYHINNNYEVKECNASIQENCPFFGNFGNNNHYQDYIEATKISEQVLAKNLGTFSETNSNFINNRNEISYYLKKFGFVREGHLLPEVKSMKEIVNKWFAGDKEKYSTFKKIISKEDLSIDTKKDITILIMRGCTINTTENVKTLGNQNSASDASEITIISENSDKITLEDLRTGQYNLFLDN